MVPCASATLGGLVCPSKPSYPTSGRWPQPCSMPTTSTLSTAMSNPKICCWMTVVIFCSVTLAWRSSLPIRRNTARMSWHNRWQAPRAIWLLSSCKVGRNEPVTNMPLGWSFTSGSLARHLLKELPSRLPCNISPCRLHRCANRSPTFRLPSKWSCCGHWRKTPTSAFLTCRTLLRRWNKLYKGQMSPHLILHHSHSL